MRRGKEVGMNSKQRIVYGQSLKVGNLFGVPRAQGNKLIRLEGICVWRLKREKPGYKLALRDIDYVSCVRHCAKRFLYIILFNTPDNSVWWIL